MTPEKCEHFAAEILEAEGWDVTVTPLARDYGVDIIAARSGQRLAVR